ncbi:hypothetical protein DCAR_0311908 [Daucus carota subsp. sativus]|uniref:Uncharacterized protein n=1 Tax=Daucus carota subsp. sativus TaxID=79200 RepID=A0A161WSQ8_DAUCS|nr:hypothetical protein DCAR_0311908 [Daucus carota subsp. sativus]
MPSRAHLFSSSLQQRSRSFDVLECEDQFEDKLPKIGWTDLGEMSEPSYATLTYEFLSSLTVSSNGTLSFKIANVQHEVTEAQLATMFGWELIEQQAPPENYATPFWLKITRLPLKAMFHSLPILQKFLKIVDGWPSELNADYLMGMHMLQRQKSAYVLVTHKRAALNATEEVNEEIAQKPTLEDQVADLQRNGDGGMNAGMCPNRAESLPMNTRTRSLVLVNYFPDTPSSTQACKSNSAPLADMVNTCRVVAGFVEMIAAYQSANDKEWFQVLNQTVTALAQHDMILALLEGMALYSISMERVISISA